MTQANIEQHGTVFSPGLIRLIEIGGPILLVVIIMFSYLGGIWSEGVQRESEMNQSYMDNQNQLSTFMAGFAEILGVTNMGTKAQTTFMVDVMKGRYEGHTSAQPGQGQLFSAITENYPGTDLTKNYDKLVNYITAQREIFKNKQTGLLSLIQSYDNWKGGSMIGHFFVSMMGFPSHGLRACVHRNCTYGADAEVQMNDILITKGTAKAFEDSEMPVLAP